MKISNTTKKTNNKELETEFLKSVEKGTHTDKYIKMLYDIILGCINSQKINSLKLSKEDKEDIIQNSILNCIRYIRIKDDNKHKTFKIDNKRKLFNYITTIYFNELKKYFNNINIHKEVFTDIDIIEFE